MISIAGADVPVDQRPAIGFLQPDVDHAAITTGCRSVVIAMALETDSDGIGFERAASAADCPPSKAAIDEELLSALAAVERWAVVDSNMIELRGPRAIRLERVPT